MLIAPDAIPEGFWAGDLEIGPDGVFWIRGVGRSGLMAVSWDGTQWTWYGPWETEAGFGPAHFAADGTVWLSPLTKVDGASLTTVDWPRSPTNRRPGVGSVAHAPDGSIWVVVLDQTPRAECLRNVRNDGECHIATDGLYVITPEAVAATE
jgi:hypothetical protein